MMLILDFAKLKRNCTIFSETTKGREMQYVTSSPHGVFLKL